MSCRQLAFVMSAAIGLLGSTALLAAERGSTATQPPSASPSKTAGPKQGLPAAKLVDINSASKAELKTLPGIGDAEAERIIQARPYPSKTKLAVDQVISGPLYEALQGKIAAVPPGPPTKAKTDTRAAPKP
jgi:competence protein ComEA